MTVINFITRLTLLFQVISIGFYHETIFPKRLKCIDEIERSSAYSQSSLGSFQRTSFMSFRSISHVKPS